MGRRRKTGVRSKSGRLSRAYQGVAKETVTPELLAKKLTLVNRAADPALSASAASILFAHNAITREQHDAAGAYHLCYALTFGTPWHRPTGDGRPVSDEILARAKIEPDAMVAALDHEQKQQIDNVVICNWLPGWFYARLGIGRGLPSDERERAALITGLEALARL
jgi:hypothetical protein